MKLVRCEKGHFYDQDKNGDRCPYCAQMASQAQASAVLNAGQAASQIQKQEPQREQQSGQGADLSSSKGSTQEAKPSSPKPSSQGARLSSAPYAERSAKPASSRNAAVSPQNTRNAALDEEDNCTVGYYSRVIGVEPVVGWLVCTEGEYKGESFKLKSGRNFIGRAANMDVVLSADHSVSRYKHAAVIYEPRSRQFIVTEGESRELCYLNGEVVLSNLKMKAYDVLNIGNTSLMLIPCCGERFTWETGLTKVKPAKNVIDEK